LCINHEFCTDASAVQNRFASLPISSSTVTQRCCLNFQDNNGAESQWGRAHWTLEITSPEAPRLKGFPEQRQISRTPLSIVFDTERRGKASYPKASILEAGRLVFNIKGNDYRLIARVQYQASVLAIRFFGTHAEYDEIDAERV
jgi:mRNA-degrading endonuclease HigB of HigAB toxin-antitoxin module